MPKQKALQLRPMPKRLQPPQPKPKKKRQPKTASSAVQMRTDRVRISECALKYALAITCPFDSRAFGVCNPAGKEAMTQPAHSLQRIIVTIGTGGVGWLLFSPTIAFDCINAFYTTSAFTGTRTVALSGDNVLTTGVATATPSTLPYNGDEFANTTDFDSENLAGRVVAVGLSASYIGTELNKSGLTVALTDPAHMSTCGCNTTDLGSYQEVVFGPNSRIASRIQAYAVCDREDQVSWLNPGPSDSSLLYPYSNGNYSFNTTYKGPTAYAYNNSSSTTAPVGSPPMVMMFTGVAGQQVLVEAITHVEYVGQLAQSKMRRAHTDVQGAATVKIAAGTLTTTTGTEPRPVATYWRDMARAIGTVSRDFVTGYLSPELSRLSIMNG